MRGSPRVLCQTLGGLATGGPCLFKAPTSHGGIFASVCFIRMGSSFTVYSLQFRVSSFSRSHLLSLSPSQNSTTENTEYFSRSCTEDYPCLSDADLTASLDLSTFLFKFRELRAKYSGLRSTFISLSQNSTTESTKFLHQVHYVFGFSPSHSLAFPQSLPLIFSHSHARFLNFPKPAPDPTVGSGIGGMKKQ